MGGRPKVDSITLTKAARARFDIEKWLPYELEAYLGMDDRQALAAESTGSSATGASACDQRFRDAGPVQAPFRSTSSGNTRRARRCAACRRHAE